MCTRAVESRYDCLMHYGVRSSDEPEGSRLVEAHDLSHIGLSEKAHLRAEGVRDLSCVARREELARLFLAIRCPVRELRSFGVRAVRTAVVYEVDPVG